MTRVVVAQMSHETNTFSPVSTDLARFSRGHPVPPGGDDAIRTYRGTATCLGGYLAVCEGNGFDVVLPVAAGAAPSGPVEDEAFEHIAGRIVDAVAAGCDAVMLDLHGAMVTRSHDDGEGELLQRVRAVNATVPIAVSLDMHANLFDAVVENCTVLTGYHTYPHVDMDATAVRAGRLLAATLNGKVNPVMAWGNAPMLPHVMRQGTDDLPNRMLQARAARLETEGALAVSLFTGFPHADVREAGLSACVVTDGDLARAEAIRDDLLDAAWAERERFVYRPEPLEESVTRGKRLGLESPGEGPVILLDHYDNTASGGTMDTTEVLAEILRQKLEDVAVFGIYDPQAVRIMATAGVGAEVTLSLGGNLTMPALAEQSAPLEITGRVKLLSDGEFPATVAMSRGLTLQMGPTAVLAAGSVDIVVVSRHVEPFDPGCLRAVGIEPTARRYLMLKSRIHYRVGFRDMARAVVECAGRGVCTSDYAQLRFDHVRRPIYPLDGVNTRDRLTL
jgi:microcystin degradation protein MlrC